MADDYKVLVTGVVTVGIAVTAYLLYQAPLKSSRPPGQQSDLPSHAVTARLWEDPLEAAEAHAKAAAHPKTAHHVDEVWKDKATADSISVLLVMTDGTPYPEGHEFRLNTRYALVSALGVACYVPKGDLHYFQWSPDREPSIHRTKGPPGDSGKGTRPAETDPHMDTGRDPINVPYEWYEIRSGCQKSNVPARVLMLWINNETVSQRPLHGLAALIHTLCAARDATKRCPQVDFKVIGPPDSDTFRNMLEEAMTNASSAEKINWPRNGSMELFSPWVTAAEVLRLEKMVELERLDTGSDPKHTPQTVVSS
ncbi:MAG TPA: hypothetical protein VHQ67_03230, partial [Nitrospiraceae bacterium]|nr:hypothetical protein [Nitrospiraceae bacterium]